MSNASRVESLLFAALEKPTAAERTAFLDSACAGDNELRRQVEKLLQAHANVGDFLQKPVGEQLAAVPEPLDATQEIASTDGPGARPADRTGHYLARTEGAGASEEDSSLAFLQPSTRPDSLGRLGHYEILQLLGQGGFGIVFRVFDEQLQRVVAIKVLAPEMAVASPARKRFLREARSSARVRHENIVQIYTVEEEPLPYLVMEFVPGETLQQRLDRTGPLEVAEVVQLGRQIAEGLAAAHDQGLIHRDIKPGNILIEAGPHPHARITDFGLARAADDASLTQSGVVAGTPQYMAPEQASADPLDHRADLFSLGSVLYVMCSGRPPFRAPSTLAVLKRVVEDTPRPIREIIPEVPEWLCDLIAKLHAKKPDDRFATAREVADLLGRGLAEMHHPGSVKPPSVAAPAVPKTPPSQQTSEAAPTIKPRLGSRRWLGAAAMLLVLLGGFSLTEATGVTNVRGTVIRLFSPEGTLVVEVDDPSVSIKIDGSDLVITGAGAKEIRLKPGSYTVEARKDGKVVSRELVTVTKNGKQVVRVSQEAEPWIDAQRWEKSVAALPAAEQVETVARRLKELNPGFNGNLFPTIEDGVVTGLIFVSDHVADISPVRALAGLKRLECPGANPPNSKSKVADLSPLRGMKLTLLNCNMTMIADLSDLRGMPLEELRLSETRVADLSPLRGMPLKRLEINQTQVADVTPLKGMPLEALGMRETQVADLSPLRGMPLEALDFGGTRVTDLKPLKGMPLTRLIIYRTEVADLAPLRGMALENLEMSGTAVTDLSPLKGMPLKHLHIFESFRAERDAAILRSLTTLQTIDDKPAADFWKETDGKTAAEKKDPDRRAAEYVLSISGGVCINGEDRGLRAVAELPQEPFRLTHVDLTQNKQVTDAGLSYFDGCTNVTVISLYDCGQITDAGLAHLKGCKGITRLSLEGVSVTDAGLANFKEYKNLEYLQLGQQTQVTDAGLAHLKDCKKLTTLHLYGCGPVTDTGLAHLKDSKQLTLLDLRGTQVTDAGLAYFKDCKDLTGLWLAGTAITDAGLAHFKDCRNLTDVFLDGTAITDAGLALVKDCKDLQHLRVNGTKVSDAGLAHVKDCKNLWALQVQNTKVSDAGLAHVKDCKNLKVLNVRDTKVSAAGIETLKKALPGCKIEWDGGVIEPK